MVIRRSGFPSHLLLSPPPSSGKKKRTRADCFEEDLGGGGGGGRRGEVVVRKRVTMDLLDYVGVITILFYLSSIVVTLLSLVFRPLRSMMSYGKHSRGWVSRRAPPVLIHALVIRGTVANRLAWTSFYAIGLTINTVLLFGHIYESSLSWAALSPSIMLECQFARRLLECIFVHKFTNRYIPLLHYAFGVSFYFFTPLVPYLDEMLYSRAPSPSRIVTAAILFSAASLLQCLVHIRLADSKSQGGNVKYGVPRGGLFELVAAPHYNAEVVIYTALVSSLPPASTVLTPIRRSLLPFLLPKMLERYPTIRHFSLLSLSPAKNLPPSLPMSAAHWRVMAEVIPVILL